jgi:hypothetical protein
MRTRWKVAACVVACLASAPAFAQSGGILSDDNSVLWNIIGLIGLLGLRGLWRDSDNDGYTDDPV